MQIRLNKLDFTELYFSGNKVDALQGIFNGQPGSYKPRRLFCIQFALCLHTYKSKIKGWRADGGALSLPSYCWFSCCVVWRRLGVGSAPARSPQQLISSIHTYQSIDNCHVHVHSLFYQSTVDMCIRYSISRHTTWEYATRSLDNRHMYSCFNCSSVDMCVRY